MKLEGEKNLDERGTEIRSKFVCTMHIVCIMKSITSNRNFIECYEIW